MAELRLELRSLTGSRSTSCLPGKKSTDAWTAKHWNDASHSTQQTIPPSTFPLPTYLATHGRQQKYMAAMALQPPPTSEPERLPMPSRNPLPLSASQEAQVRDIFYQRVRSHCGPEIKGWSLSLPSRFPPQHHPTAMPD